MGRGVINFDFPIFSSSGHQFFFQRPVLLQRSYPKFTPLIWHFNGLIHHRVAILRVFRPYRNKACDQCFYHFPKGSAGSILLNVFFDVFMKHRRGLTERLHTSKLITPGNVLIALALTTLSSTL